MNKFIVKPNKSVKEIIEGNQRHKKHQIDLALYNLNESAFNNENDRWWPNCSTMINPAELR